MRHINVRRAMNYSRRPGRFDGRKAVVANYVCAMKQETTVPVTFSYACCTNRSTGILFSIKWEKTNDVGKVYTRQDYSYFIIILIVSIVSYPDMRNRKYDFYRYATWWQCNGTVMKYDHCVSCTLLQFLSNNVYRRLIVFNEIVIKRELKIVV